MREGDRKTLITLNACRLTSRHLSEELSSLIICSRNKLDPKSASRAHVSIKVNLNNSFGDGIDV